MKCICGNLPLVKNNIDRISDEVAKLRQAVIDGRYDPRSIVGDAVLVMEGQIKQALEILESRNE